jgi:glutaredoxin
MRRRLIPSRLLSAIAAGAVAIIGLLAFLFTAEPAGAASPEDFGRCLARKGATFYGASWCPHCRGQQQTLGDAMPGVRYVECAVQGRRDTPASACTAAGIESYPTWVFADGTRAQGEQSLAALASKTGCTLPSSGGKAADASGSKAANASGGKAAAPTKKNPSGSQPPSGPKIIEVPQ